MTRPLKAIADLFWRVTSPPVTTWLLGILAVVSLIAGDWRAAFLMTYVAWLLHDAARLKRENAALRAQVASSRRWADLQRLLREAQRCAGGAR